MDSFMEGFSWLLEQALGLFLRWTDDEEFTNDLRESDYPKRLHRNAPKGGVSHDC